MQVNPAMKEGSIDASIFQSTAYMDAINKEIGADMVGGCLCSRRSAGAVLG
ncbi:MetQ/NlpA family ABC transporter substrate-binding protein [Paenibacillus rhizoplanae]